MRFPHHMLKRDRPRYVLLAITGTRNGKVHLVCPVCGLDRGLVRDGIPPAALPQMSL